MTVRPRPHDDKPRGWLRELLIWLRKHLQRALALVALLLIGLIVVVIWRNTGEPSANPCDTIDDQLANTAAVELAAGTYACTIVVTQPGRILTGSPDGTTVTDVMTVAAEDVTVKGVRFDGGAISIKPPARNVLVEDNDFTACQGICVKLKRDDLTNAQPRDITIRHNNLHDSSGHFVGTTGTDIDVDHNTFTDAKSPGCEAKKCPEFVRVQAGGTWRITNNRLTNAEAHGPQIRVFPTNGFTPAIHDILIANNIASTDKADSFIVDIEGAQTVALQALRVYVVNNTFLGLTGKQAVGIDDLGPPPIVANNLIVNQGGEKECDRALYLSNVARKFKGTPCPGIELGDFDLTDDGIPTDTDLNRQYVIDKAATDPAGCRCVPETDINGVPRTPPFDRGAAEHEG